MPTIISVPDESISCTSKRTVSGAIPIASETLTAMVFASASTAPASVRSEDDAAGFGLVHKAGGHRLQHHRIADLVGDAAGVLRRIDGLASDVGNAGVRQPLHGSAGGSASDPIVPVAASSGTAAGSTMAFARPVNQLCRDAKARNALR